MTTQSTVDKLKAQLEIIAAMQIETMPYERIVEVFDAGERARPDVAAEVFTDAWAGK